ncbi:hypothetical protein HAX54_005361, partial [Datura stramonium]|nr:hypothetical protein [Datura stramonium]
MHFVNSTKGGERDGSAFLKTDCPSLHLLKPKPKFTESRDDSGDAQSFQNTVRILNFLLKETEFPNLMEGT